MVYCGLSLLPVQSKVQKTPYKLSMRLFPSAQMKVGCDNTVVRMVSSGKFVNRVSFQYRLLGHQELQQMKGNSVEDVCLRA